MLAAMLAFALAVAPATRVPVYVKSAGAVDGWTDPSGDRADSARDLRRHVAADTRKAIRAVDTEADGAVVLEVLERRREFRTLVLVVRVTAGDYTTTLTSTSDVSLGSWRDCARKIAVQLDTWVAANRARLAGTP